MIDGHTAIKAIVWMMGTSVASGFCLIFKFSSPAPAWLDHPTAYKRWIYRGLLFMACFLPPVSVWAVVLDALAKLDLFESVFGPLPSIARWAAFGVPILVLWYLWFRAVAASVRSNGRASEGRTGKPVARSKR